MSRHIDVNSCIQYEQINKKNTNTKKQTLVNTNIHTHVHAGLHVYVLICIDTYKNQMFIHTYIHYTFQDTYKHMNIHTHTPGEVVGGLGEPVRNWIKCKHKLSRA